MTTIATLSDRQLRLWRSGEHGRRPGAALPRSKMSTAMNSNPAIKVAHNVVVIGAQWGDEGKGKIVDLLTDRVAARGALPGRPQRRPHAGDQRQEDRAAPDSLGNPARRRDLLHRQRRRAVAESAVRGDGRARASRHRSAASPAHLGSVPADPAVSHRARSRARSGDGRGEDRHDRPRHRPGLRRQGRAPRDPRAGPVRARALRGQARRSARLSQLRAAPLLQGADGRLPGDARRSAGSSASA